MRFQNYLQEKVIKPDIVITKRIVKKVDQLVRDFIRNNPEGNISLNDIDRWRYSWDFGSPIKFTFFMAEWNKPRSSKFIINGLASSSGIIDIILSLEFCNFIKNIVNSTPTMDATALDKAMKRLFNNVITENRLLGKEKSSSNFEQKIIDDIRKQFHLEDKYLKKKQRNLFDKRKKDITTTIPWDEIREYVSKKKWHNTIASVEKKIENLEKDPDYKNFITRNLYNTLQHEFVHIEQFHKVKNLSPKHGRKSRDIKRFGTDVYYHDRMEQMAHADTMLNQLKDAGYDNETIGKMLRNPNKYTEELMKSQSYTRFKNAIKDEKHWQRFMKYIYQYWEEKDEI